jgi:formate C-acetyltransferase
MIARHVEQWTYERRLAALRKTKLEQTRQKQEVLGAMDHDDWALILPPPNRRQVAHSVSGSGVPITDCVFGDFRVRSNHPSGGFFGPRCCGENFRALLETHPTYLDPMSSLAGGYMVNFMSWREPHWNPDFDYAHLQPEQEKYKLDHGIGFVQHFCQDLQIGLELGWQGLLDKIRRYRQLNAPHGEEFYAGLEHVILGMQDWIRRHAADARLQAAEQVDPELRANLEQLADLNERLVTEPPATFREACQWILWFQMAARMYNGSGSLGQLDVLLWPYYERDAARGLSDDEATFHIACLLLRDTGYLQLGGPDAEGRDQTNRVSYLTLEALHQLKIPANVGVCVGDGVDPQLLRRGVEILLADKLGIPKFLGVENTAAGFARSGYPLALGRQRVYSGCHWCALPGREYTFNDGVKVNFAVILEIAWREMLAERSASPSVAELWRRFEQHLRRAVAVLAAGLDFHIEHMDQVFPELVLDLCCHGTIEKGLDASHGGVEYYNFAIEGAALATVADSLAAVEQRVEQEQRLTWQQLQGHLEHNWAGPDGERARHLMRTVPRFGSGGSRADEYAVRIARTFSEIVVEKPTPAGFKMIPALFSWAFAIRMGEQVGATPNGRRSGDPISHGPNPHPGFRRDGAPTAMAAAVAAVQPGYGNTAPWQIDLDPLIPDEEHGVDLVCSLIRGHFRLGGTQININILDAATLVEAHHCPERFPDLIVRVTGFSTYFATLSPQQRQLIVDRMIRT